MIDKVKLAVVGLGYVGLPLAVEFGLSSSVIGFDISEERVAQLNNGIDLTNEISRDQLLASRGVQFTTDPRILKRCNCFIVAVPTPVDLNKNPDLSYLRTACEIVASQMSAGAVVIFESTVYPGCTEEFCVPILEQLSNLKFNETFFCGYSPERVNPGDREHTISSVVKITAGSTTATADFVDDLYASIVSAGTYRAESIAIAEAAKVIENGQRDLNIAYVNELAILFNHLNIPTESVLKAAATKWNFQVFSPGLVGGHCIGVDPYYLTHKARSIGFEPKVMLAGRETNDSMSKYIANLTTQRLKERNGNLPQQRILIAGVTFKEDCPDTRNSQVISLAQQLKLFDIKVDFLDPYAEESTSYCDSFYRYESQVPRDRYDGIIIAVRHKYFLQIGVDAFKAMKKKSGFIFDLKYTFEPTEVEFRL